jgi:four helix bundle protein
VFKRAYRLSLEVHRLSLGLPALDQDALADQIRRGSKSVCANLAEGFARQGVQPADFRRYLIMALGSADEMRLWCRYCLDLGYLDEATWQIWRQEYRAIAENAAGSDPDRAAASVMRRLVCHLSSVICPLNW